MTDLHINVVEWNGVTYFKANDLSKALGYSNYKKAISTHVPDKELVTGEDIGIKGNLNDKATRYTTIRGAVCLVQSSMIPGSLQLATSLGIPLAERFKRYQHELSTIKTIMDAFEGERMLRQYTVGSYRVDLYFSEFNIVVECDENGHKHYELETELERTAYITSTLKNRWVRYNPDAKDFNVIAVVNQIYRLVRNL